MQRSHIFSILGTLALVCTSSAQENRIRFHDAWGSDIKGLHAIFHSSFGLVLPFSKDSLYVFRVSGEVKRITVEHPDFYRLDSVFEQPLSGGSIHFELQARPGMIDDVVVSVNKDAGKLKESNVSISVLKPYLIDNKITADATQIIEQVPGVTLTDNQVNIRNVSGWSYGAGSRVMVTVDDLPMLSGDANAVQWTYLPLENLASVEVVKSAGSVLYGSSALNGTINFKTREATDSPQVQINTFVGLYGNPSRPELKFYKGQHGAAGFNGFYSQKIKNTGYTFTWNFLTDQGFRMNETTKKARVGFKIKHFHSRIQGLNYGINGNFQRSNSGSFLLWQSDSLAYNSLNNGFNYSNSIKTNIDPFLEYRKGRFSHKLMGRYLAIENEIRTDNSGSDQSNGSSLFYGEYKLSGPLLQGLKFTAGAVGMGAETHSPLFDGRHYSRNLAAYLQLEYRYRRLIATGGARYEYFTLDDYAQSRPVFRAGINYAVTRYTFFRASMGQGYRFPSMGEAFIKTTTSGITIYPNPDLKAETGTNTEIGIKQGFKLGKLQGYLDAAVFQVDLDNMMEFTFAQWGDPTPPYFGLGFKSVNVGKARIRGFELESGAEGKYRSLDIKLLGGYTYTMPISLEPDLVFARIANSPGDTSDITFANTRSDSTNILKYRYLHVFRMDLQVSRGKWETGLSSRYNSRMLNIDVAFVALIKGVDKTRHLMGSQWVFDWRLAYKLKPNLKLNFQVNNLLNRVYINRPADMRPPRSFQLQLSWTPN